MTSIGGGHRYERNADDICWGIKEIFFHKFHILALYPALTDPVVLLISQVVYESTTRYQLVEWYINVPQDTRLLSGI